MCDSLAPPCAMDEPRPLIMVVVARRGSKGLSCQQTIFGRSSRRNVLSIHQLMHIMRSPQLLLLMTSLLVNLAGAFTSPTVGLLCSSLRGASRWFRSPQLSKSESCEDARRRPAVRLRVAATTAIVPQEAAWTEEDDTNNNNNDPRVGVLLLNLGGPETGDDVEGKSGGGGSALLV